MLKIHRRLSKQNKTHRSKSSFDISKYTPMQRGIYRHTEGTRVATQLAHAFQQYLLEIEKASQKTRLGFQRSWARAELRPSIAKLMRQILRASPPAIVPSSLAGFPFEIS